MERFYCAYNNPVCRLALCTSHSNYTCYWPCAHCFLVCDDQAVIDTGSTQWSSSLELMNFVKPMYAVTEFKLIKFCDPYRKSAIDRGVEVGVRHNDVGSITIVTIGERSHGVSSGRSIRIHRWWRNGRDVNNLVCCIQSVHIHIHSIEHEHTLIHKTTSCFHTIT